MATTTGSSTGTSPGTAPAGDPVARDRRVRRVIGAVVLVAALVATVWAGRWAWTELRQAQPSGSAVVEVGAPTPEAAVSAYFAALAADDDAAARAVVAPESAPVLLDALGADLGNVTAIKNLAVGAPVPVEPATTPPSVVVPATYGVLYKNQINGNNGGKARWFVVAQSGPDAAWLIREIRTSP